MTACKISFTQRVGMFKQSCVVYCGPIYIFSINDPFPPELISMDFRALQ